MKKKFYLGFSSTQHDSAIALVDENGEVLFAEANERSLKNKRAHHVPPDAIGTIEPVLKKIPEGSIIKAALTWSDSGLFWCPAIFTMTYWQKKWHEKKSGHITGGLLSTMALRQAMYKSPKSNRDMLLNLEYRLFESKWKNKNFSFQKKGHNHHLCHAATACFTSHYKEGICLIIDGAGEGTSLSLYSFKNAEIKKIQADGMPSLASLGIWYSQVCWACGFDPISGEEWKVMGLAPLGKRDESLYQLIRPMLNSNKGQLKKSHDYNERLTKLCQLKDNFQTPLHAADLAYTSQLVFEELVCELITAVHKKYGGENLILSGGCALNSSCNGQILKNTPYKNLHIPMAPGDDGNAIGAALLAWMEDHPGKWPKIAHSPYLGSQMSEESIRRVIELGKLEARHFHSQEDLVDHVATALSQGMLVGWVQGKAEFGPRALGNRSILADPRHPDVKDKINSRIKFREEFRPFAPSILHEHGEEFFQNYQYTPYMDRTLNFSEKGKLVPGVVHHNNSGRLQSVTKELNPLYYALIHSFYQKTGVPVLLNTSFNVMGRPIVHDIEDTLGVYFSSGLDMLVIHNYVFQKN